MTLEELRQLKEKADSLLFTFQNDRQILQEEKQKREEKICQDFIQLWKELQSYLEFLIRPKFYMVKTILEDDFFFESIDVYIGCLGDLSLRVKVRDYGILCIKEKTDFSDQKIFYDKNSGRILKELLEKQEELKETTKELVALSIESNLNKQKQINDKLFNQIKDLEN